jgi:hypothetical protein
MPLSGASNQVSKYGDVVVRMAIVPGTPYRYRQSGSGWYIHSIIRFPVGDIRRPRPEALDRDVVVVAADAVARLRSPPRRLDRFKRGWTSEWTYEVAAIIPARRLLGHRSNDNEPLRPNEHLLSATPEPRRYEPNLVDPIRHGRAASKTGLGPAHARKRDRLPSSTGVRTQVVPAVFLSSRESSPGRWLNSPSQRSSMRLPGAPVVGSRPSVEST